MRSKSALILLLIVAMTVMPMSVIGQEEPLPVVTAKAVPLVDTVVPAPMVFLAAEPIRQYHSPTLIEAARANDYVTFDALYREMKARGESLGTFETLHELWTYSVTDPIGAFYGVELHDRLARVYPGYAAFIDEYRIVDDRGSVFYPTSETRAFLLDRVRERNAPRVLIAESTATQRGGEAIVPAEPRASSGRATSRAAAPGTTGRYRASSTSARTERPAATANADRRDRITSTSSAGTTGRDRRSSTGVAPTANAAAAPKNTAASAPLVVPPVEAPAQVAQSTPAVSDTPAPVPQPAPATPVNEELTTPIPAAHEVTPPIPAANDNLAGRGILLIVIGLIGIGLLALMLRTPKEPVTAVPAQKVDATPKAAEGTGPKAPVEPLRRPAGQQGPQAAAKSDSNRATGSHG